MKTRIERAAAALLATALLAASPGPARAEETVEPVRVRVEDAVLDRNGDGFQDVIVVGRSVHRDVDFDGRFDFTLSLAFKEYDAEGHRRYLASGLSKDVFVELTRKGLDNLCASERVAANWTAEHFREFAYYHDGYGGLQLLDASAGNDGRLAEKGAQARPEYTVIFNPDGTVASVRRGDRTLALASFDYEKNSASGTRVRLPRIAGPADLAAIRAQLARLFEAAPASP